MSVLGGFLVVFASIFIYFLPLVVAQHRDHHNMLAIGVLNFFLGWTLVGWVIALVWALLKPQPTTQGS
jgi:hypothetical protein